MKNNRIVNNEFVQVIKNFFADDYKGLKIMVGKKVGNGSLAIYLQMHTIEPIVSLDEKCKMFSMRKQSNIIMCFGLANILDINAYGNTIEITVANEIDVITYSINKFYLKSGIKRFAF